MTVKAKIAESSRSSQRSVGTAHQTCGHFGQPLKGNGQHRPVLSISAWRSAAWPVALRLVPQSYETISPRSRSACPLDSQHHQRDGPAACPPDLPRQVAAAALERPRVAPGRAGPGAGARSRSVLSAGSTGHGSRNTARFGPVFPAGKHARSRFRTEPHRAEPRPVARTQDGHRGMKSPDLEPQVHSRTAGDGRNRTSCPPLWRRRKARKTVEPAPEPANQDGAPGFEEPEAARADDAFRKRATLPGLRR